MPLQAPQLDTRTFEELKRLALLRIPRYAPEWTDFNESDPGVTLVELFAWLTEMLLYEMNRIPDRNYIKFLQLLGMELRPAQPAIAYLTVDAQGGALPVPPRAQFSAQPAGGGQPLVFETTEGLDLIPVPLARVQVFDGAAFTDVSAVNTNPGPTYRPFGWVPQNGSALYLGFAAPNPPVTGRFFPLEMHFRVFLPPAATAGQPESCRDVVQVPTPPVNLVWAGIGTDWDRINAVWDSNNDQVADAVFQSGDHVRFDMKGIASPYVYLTEAVTPLSVVVSNDAGSEYRCAVEPEFAGDRRRETGERKVERAVVVGDTCGRGWIEAAVGPVRNNVVAVAAIQRKPKAAAAVGDDRAAVELNHCAGNRAAVNAVKHAAGKRVNGRLIPEGVVLIQMVYRHIQVRPRIRAESAPSVDRRDRDVAGRHDQKAVAAGRVRYNTAGAAERQRSAEACPSVPFIVNSARNEIGNRRYRRGRHGRHRGRRHHVLRAHERVRRVRDNCSQHKSLCS